MSKTKKHAVKLTVSHHLSNKPGLIGPGMPMMNASKNVFTNGGLSN